MWNSIFFPLLVAFECPYWVALITQSDRILWGGSGQRLERLSDTTTI